MTTSSTCGLYHMSTNVSSFFDRHIYDKGLFNRYGEPSSLEDYLLKAQIMDYEATRSEFEGYSAKWNADHPATGAIYWMLNNAWPSLHWNLFDYYLHPAGAYFGAKVGSRQEHVAYGYDGGKVYLINHSLDKSGSRNIHMELMDLSGKLLSSRSVNVQTEPNTSKQVTAVSGLSSIKDVAFLRLVLSGANGEVLSRNVYWLATTEDKLAWDRSSWFSTPVTEWADFTALNSMKQASVSATVKSSSSTSLSVSLENKADVPAFFVRLNLVDANGDDVTPVLWTDNYVTLWPKEKLELEVSYPEGTGSVSVEMSGGNVGAQTVKSS
jgi:exo-1,4-beta-D-glucosaminidase